MDTNGISSFLVNHTWTGNEGVNTNSGWHGATERPHTPPLLKEVCLAGGHIDFTFTSIEESTEECGTSFDIPSKQAMLFVDEANSDVMHTSFNHGGNNIHACQYLVNLVHRSHTLHQSGGIGMFLSHIKPEKYLIPQGDNASNPRRHDGQEVVLSQ